MFDKFLHKTLRIPYKLSVTENSGSGMPIVFLHGIASSSFTWRNVLPIVGSGYRRITIDLLGFGNSPKPEWAHYSLVDHADAVARTIKKLRLKQPVILVGHSMGSLIAVSLANRHPKLVKRLVLCSMPLYMNNDLDSSVVEYKKTDRALNNAYFNVYQAITERPDLTLKGARQIVKLAGNETSFRLDETTWVPFKQSLKNSIEGQSTLSDIQSIDAPIDILYGRFDVFVISKYFKKLAQTHKNISIHAVNGRHEISPLYARKIVEVIEKDKHKHTI